MQTAGFPNLFFPGGPHAAAGNNPRYNGDQVDFVTDALGRRPRPRLRRRRGDAPRPRSAGRRWSTGRGRDPVRHDRPVRRRQHPRQAEALPPQRRRAPEAVQGDRPGEGHRLGGVPAHQTAFGPTPAEDRASSRQRISSSGWPASRKAVAAVCVACSKMPRPLHLARTGGGDRRRNGEGEPATGAAAPRRGTNRSRCPGPLMEQAPWRTATCASRKPTSNNRLSSPPRPDRPHGRPPGHQVRARSRLRTEFEHDRLRARRLAPTAGGGAAGRRAITRWRWA